MEAAHRLLQARIDLGHGPRLWVEIDEDEAAELLHPYGGDGEVGLVEPFHPFAMGCCPQGAGAVVGPGVIGAGDELARPSLALKQDMAAMLAHIEEGAQSAVLAAHGTDILPGELSRHIGAGFGHLACRAQIEP